MSDDRHALCATAHPAASFSTRPDMPVEDAAATDSRSTLARCIHTMQQRDASALHLESQYHTMIALRIHDVKRVFSSAVCSLITSTAPNPINLAMCTVHEGRNCSTINMLWMSQHPGCGRCDASAIRCTHYPAEVLVTYAEGPQEL